MYKNFNKLQFWAEDRIGILAFDNGVNNALDIELLSEILGALSIEITDKNIDSIVITGTKSVFSTGFDFSCGKFEKKEEFQELLNLGHSIATTLLSIPKTVVSIINGNAFDAGFELVLLSDVILSKNDVKVGFPGLWYNIPHIIGTPSLFSSIYGKNSYYRFISSKVDNIQNLNIVTKFLPPNTLMSSAKDLLLNMPFFQNQFKGEIFNLYRLQTDFERYDIIASNSTRKTKELSSFVSNIK
jgi:enoyl-CoA hydratase/carnithine racemase